MMNILNSGQIVIPASESEMVVGEPCAVIWDLPSGRDWYLGFVTSVIDNDTYIVDHLERSTRDESKMCWRYPRRQDEHEVEITQIIPCNVIGAWSQTNTRKQSFELSNWEIIEGVFRSLYE